MSDNELNNQNDTGDAGEINKSLGGTHASDNRLELPPDIAERAAISPKRTAHVIDCSIVTVYELINAGKLDARRFGKRNTRITTASIRRLLGAA
jgi:hypothetical protein